MIMIRIRVRRPHDLLFPTKSARQRLVAKVNVLISNGTSETCDQLRTNGSSLFFDLVGATAPVRKSTTIFQLVLCADYSAVAMRCQVFSVTLGKFKELYSGCSKRRRKQCENGADYTVPERYCQELFQIFPNLC